MVLQAHKETHTRRMGHSPGVALDTAQGQVEGHVPAQLLRRHHQPLEVVLGATVNTKQCEGGGVLHTRTLAHTRMRMTDTHTHETHADIRDAEMPFYNYIGYLH